MRVLWICNIVLPAVAKQLKLEVSNKEGWVSGLCSVILQKQQENRIELHVAFPVPLEMDGCQGTVDIEGHSLHYNGFFEDVLHAERYDQALERKIADIIEQVEPDVIHCFGTEYAHSLAAARCCKTPARMLVGLQGICTVIAQAYMAGLPEDVQRRVTFRDWLKRDSLQEQQRKYEARGLREQEIVRLAGNVTGRTDFDRFYAKQWNDDVCYYNMNETLRPCFYEKGGKNIWSRERCAPHTIFVSQGDYPLKGLHYLLEAAAELVKRYPDLEIRVAGNSLVNYRTLKDRIKISAYGSYLRHLIGVYHLGDKVHFLGKLNAEEMKQAYLDSSLFVCCSSNENSPNSLGEAMILGVPCVAADVGGIPSLFVDGEDGILYRGYHSDEILFDSRRDCASEAKTEQYSLISAISAIWDNETKTDVFCRNARNHAEKTHSVEMNYYKMMEIYASMVGGERL